MRAQVLATRVALRRGARRAASSSASWGHWDWDGASARGDSESSDTRGDSNADSESSDASLAARLHEATDGDGELMRAASAALAPFLTDARRATFERVLSQRSRRCRVLFERPSNPNNVRARCASNTKPSHVPFQTAARAGLGVPAHDRLLRAAARRCLRRRRASQPVFSACWRVDQHPAARAAGCHGCSSRSAEVAHDRRVAFGHRRRVQPQGERLCLGRHRSGARRGGRAGRALGGREARDRFRERGARYLGRGALKQQPCPRHPAKTPSPPGRCARCATGESCCRCEASPSRTTCPWRVRSRKLRRPEPTQRVAARSRLSRRSVAARFVPRLSHVAAGGGIHAGDLSEDERERLRLRWFALTCRHSEAILRRAGVVLPPDLRRKHGRAFGYTTKC